LDCTGRRTPSYFPVKKWPARLFIPDETVSAHVAE
jgi:hypothetical protein